MSNVVPLEKAVVARVTRRLDEKGAWWVKTTGVAKVGCPDLLVCYMGMFIALEVKREHNGSYGASAKQRYELKKIKEAGGWSAVVASVQDVDDVLTELASRIVGG